MAQDNVALLGCPTWPDKQSQSRTQFVTGQTTRGEGACSRSVAQRPRNLGSAAQPSGSKLPRHGYRFTLRGSSAVRRCPGRGLPIAHSARSFAGFPGQNFVARLPGRKPIRWP
ncbi:hypothetical protein FHK92_22660 [Pseudomonas brassicacearum subsp. neoaurantiaca]|uniref:Uncharacterized protein n=1 Tax=Pseudomonas brassicacearum subsp. neoaurantiaca TaxID=494916 RepID=A0A7V8ZUX3_9PSED|nr:hypothetical protein [Pseudomonas brassicacearum subsp. neoaurantiaca]